MDNVCIEITKIVKRELSSIDSFVNAKCAPDGSTNSGNSINNCLKKCKQKDRNLERKKSRRPEGEGREGKKDVAATHRMSVEFSNDEPITRASTSGSATEPHTSMSSSNVARRNNDKEVKERANGSKTNLRVKVKASKKSNGSKASKESKEEGKPRCWFGKTNVDEPSSTTLSFPELPADERSRRRLSDSLEQLENHSPPRARRRSVSFDPLTVFKTAILQNDADTVRAILDTGKVGANTILDGSLPVVLAAKDGCAECLELLIEKGARIDARSKQGLSPLELAVREGHFDCAQCLISSGANANCIRDGYFDEGIESANRATTRSRSKTF